MLFPCPIRTKKLLSYKNSFHLCISFRGTTYKEKNPQWRTGFPTASGTRFATVEKVKADTANRTKRAVRNFAFSHKKRGAVSAPLQVFRENDSTAAAVAEEQDHESNDDDPGAVIVEKMAKAVGIHSDSHRKSGETPFIDVTSGSFSPLRYHTMHALPTL